MTTTASTSPEQEHRILARPTVAVILPARNEAGRIGNILTILRRIELIDEIIVVDDGSSDETANEVLQHARLDHRIRLLQHATNQGKGQAIFTGWQATHASCLLLLDSDLIGLDTHHVIDLIIPVVNGQADMTVGLFRDGHWSTDLPHIAMPWLSGQRCLKSQLMNDISINAAQGYGFETALTIAARIKKWRLRRVFLYGISHPISEIHRGLLPGILNRIKMYHQITYAWRVLRIQSRWQKRTWVVRFRLPLIIITLMLFFSIFYDKSIAKTSRQPGDLSILSLSGSHRMLVIAPHPDDESLAAGGIIQTVLSQGGTVKVVIVTNGDGQIISPLSVNHRPIASSKDFFRIGMQRQAESTKALQILGISSQDIYFLGYPDGGLYNLWLGDWQKNCPVKSKHTHVFHSPYPNTFNPADQYCGSNLLLDLENILENYKPDIVVLPHPNDEHLDHRAVSNFTLLAIGIENSRNPDFNPSKWGYLVHYGYFPQPRGNRPSNGLMPPQSLDTVDQWVRLPMTDQQEQKKAIAIQAYHTQEMVMRSFLNSFIRTDEIFTQLPSLDIALVSFQDINQNESGILATPPFGEPAEESTRRFLIAGSDLTGLQTIRLGDTLWLNAKTRGKMIPGLNYVVYIKTPDGHTITINCNGAQNHLNSTTFFAKVNLSTLNDPSVLGFSAEVQERFTLDRTAWHFINLK